MTDLEYMINLMSQTDILKEQCYAASELKDKIESNEITVSVMGQFKRGKSSVINALLGSDILPVAIIPLTTVVTEIRYGENFKSVVFYENGSNEDISPSELEDFCSEEKNPGNSKGVKTVKIWTPLHPFGKGTVLVDTPGVGSVNKHNTDSSYSYIKESDVILFLLSVDSPVSESERDFLLKSDSLAAKFFFGINKSDTVSEEDLEKFKEYCRKTISGYIEKDVNIISISAKKGYGIDTLKEVINNELKDSRKELLNASINKKADLIIAQAKAKLTLALKSATMPVDDLREKLDRIDERLTDIHSFSDELEVISSHRASNLIEKIKAELTSEGLLLLDDANKNCNALYKEMSDSSPKVFESDFTSSINEYMENNLNKLNNKGLSLLTSGYNDIVEVLKKKATDTASFITLILQEEFGLDYPLNEIDFNVSEKNDFFLRIGYGTKVFLDMSAVNRLLPKKTANERIYKKALAQIPVDIERNTNNMVYNYKYKMQESLRFLCNELIDEISGMYKELNNLKDHIKNNLEVADEEKNIEIDKLTFISENLNKHNS